MTTEDRLVEVTLALENVLENVEITADGVWAEAEVWVKAYNEDQDSYELALVKLSDPIAAALLHADELLNRLDNDSSLVETDEVDLNEE